MSKPICADRGCKDKAHGHSFNFKSKGDLDKYRASKREVAGKMGKRSLLMAALGPKADSRAIFDKKGKVKKNIDN